MNIRKTTNLNIEEQSFEQCLNNASLNSRHREFEQNFSDPTNAKNSPSSCYEWPILERAAANKFLEAYLVISDSNVTTQVYVKIQTWLTAKRLLEDRKSESERNSENIGHNYVFWIGNKTPLEIARNMQLMTCYRHKFSSHFKLDLENVYNAQSSNFSIYNNTCNPNWWKMST